MSSDFAFRGRARRVARAIVDAMVPRWPEFPHDLTDPVLEQVEDMVRQHPPAVRAGLVGMLLGLEVSGPLVRDGLRPTSSLDRARVTRRLERLGAHPLPQVRNLTMFFKILVSFAAYSRPEVEAFLGVRRRAWRANRRAFREQLIRLDEARGAEPAVPAPLSEVEPGDYLRFEGAAN